MCLELGFDPFDFTGTKIQVEGETFECDDDMAAALLSGIDRCRQFLGKTFVELRVDTTPWVGHDEDGNPQGGTLDFGCIGEDLIVISDLKFGRNIPVEAIKNYQQVLYALGFYHQVAKHLTKATRFLIIIDQPRNAAGGGEWEVSLDELEAMGEWIKVRAAETFNPNAPCTPSKDACTWCPAAKKMGACPEYESWTLSLFEQDIQDLDDFDDFGSEMTLPDPAVMTPARVSAIYMHRAMLRAFIDRVEKLITSETKSGFGDRYGMKLVEGDRSRRYHIDPKKSEEWLLENGFDSELIIHKELKSPSKLDKIVGRGKFPGELIRGGEKQHIAVPLEDARLAIPTEAATQQEVDDLDDFE